MVIIKRWEEPRVDEETVTKVVTKAVTRHVTLEAHPTVFITRRVTPTKPPVQPVKVKGWEAPLADTPQGFSGGKYTHQEVKHPSKTEGKESPGKSVESAMMKQWSAVEEKLRSPEEVMKRRWGAIEDKLKSQEVTGHEAAVSAEREAMKNKSLAHHEPVSITEGSEGESQSSISVPGIVGTRGPGRFEVSPDVSTLVGRIREILERRGAAMDEAVRREIYRQYERAGKYKDALRMANYALAMINVLGAKLSESTYSSLRSTLIDLRDKLVSPKLSDVEKAAVAAQIMELYNKIKDRFIQHAQSIGQMKADELSESVDTFAGVGGAIPTFERSTVMSLPGGQGRDIHVELPESVAKRLEEEYKKAEEGMVPAPTLADQVVWGAEKAVNVAAFWPQMVSEKLASHIDEMREKYRRKADEALNKGDRDEWQKNMYAVQILDALSMLTRFGGSAATAGYDVALTALTGGAALPVIVGAAADNLARSVTDDWQKEAITESMKDPELFAKYVLPVLAGSVVGGVAGAKAVSASTDWVLRNLNAGGKTGALARALFKVGQRTGVFKTVKFTSEPTQSSVMFVKSQDGRVHVVVYEKGNVRVASKVPVSDDFSVRLQFLKGKNPQLADEIITYIKEAALTRNPKAIQALDKLVKTLSNVDDETIQWVAEALKKMKEVDPDKIMRIEAYIRMTKGGNSLPKNSNVFFEGRINNEFVRGGMSVENARKYDMYYKKVMQWMEKSNPDKGTVEKVLKFYEATGLSPDEISPDEVALMTRKLGASRFEKILKIFSRSSSELDELANMRKLQQIARIYREGENVGHPNIPYSPEQLLRDTSAGKLAKLLQNMDDAEWNAFLRLIKAKYGEEGVQVIKHLYNPAKESVGVRVTVGTQGQSVTFEGGVGRGWRVQGATYSEVDVKDVLKALRRFNVLRKGSEGFVISEKTLVLPRGKEAQFLEQLVSKKNVMPVDISVDSQGNAVYAVKLKDFLNIMKKFNVEPNEFMEVARGAPKDSVVLVKVYNKVGAPKSVRVVLVSPKGSSPVVGYYRSVRVIQIEPKEFLKGIAWEEAKRAVSKNEFEGALRWVLMQARRISQEQNVSLDEALQIAKRNFITKLMKDVGKAGNVATQGDTVFSTVGKSGGMKAVVLTKLIDKAVDELSRQMKSLPRNVEPVTVVADVNPASMGVAVAVVTLQKGKQEKGEESKSEAKQVTKEEKESITQGESFQPWFIELPPWWEIWAHRDRLSQVSRQSSSTGYNWEARNPPTYIKYYVQRKQESQTTPKEAESKQEVVSYPSRNLWDFTLIRRMPGGRIMIQPRGMPWAVLEPTEAVRTHQVSSQFINTQVNWPTNTPTQVITQVYKPTHVVPPKPTHFTSPPWTVPKGPTYTFVNPPRGPTHPSTQVITQVYKPTHVVPPKVVLTKVITVFATVGSTVLVTQYVTPTVVVTETAMVTQIVTQWVTQLAKTTQHGGGGGSPPSNTVIAPIVPPVVPPFFTGTGRPSVFSGFYSRSGRGRQREVIEL